jgi:hypothetical protein
LDPSLDVINSLYCFKGINELAEWLGFVSFVSRQKKKAHRRLAEKTKEDLKYCQFL